MTEPQPAATDPSSETIVPLGDSTVLIILGSGVDPRLAARAQSIAAAIALRRIETPAIGRAVPAHASVLVPFDPLALDLDAIIGFARDAITATAAGADPAADEDPAMFVEVPVRYGGPDGPDLDEVADRLGLFPADIVELHAGVLHRVLFLGFAPGFAYLDGLPTALTLPRRATPRERVPAGSVAIAGEQTGIYPRSMPGGWHLIGRTDATLFDPTRPEPAVLTPGAFVRFVPAPDR